MSNSTLETYDALNHLIHTEKKNPQQETVSREEQLYDRSGNLAKRISHIYLVNEPTKTIATVWEYDSQGHPILQIEAGQKTTRFTYDCRGRLATRTLPSGITLSYTYDSLGRTTELISSDQTVHYQYLYDTGPDPIQVLDLIHNIHLERSYNRFGQLLQERTPHTFLQWHYDQQGRCTQLTLPDSSSIAYLYRGKHLTAIQRHSSTAELLYEHRYTEFDLNGHVAQEELIHQIGLLQTSRDLLERPTSQTSPFLTHSIAYNLSSLVTQTQNSLLGDKHYTYDALDQLLSEGDHDYLFDSMGNPADCETDDCNQLLSTPHAKIDYDPNGNPTNRTNDDISTTYTYDALGRLTSLTTPTRKVSYSYDAFSRLLSKSSSFYANGFWFDEGVRFYLYDQGYEIGSLNSKGQLQELKVLGLGIKGDIGAAIAVELDYSSLCPSA